MANGSSFWLEVIGWWVCGWWDHSWAEMVRGTGGVACARVASGGGDGGEKERIIHPKCLIENDCVKALSNVKAPHLAP